VLGFDGNGVFQVAKHDVYLPHKFRYLGAYLLVVRRHEVNHALETHRQFEQRRRRADGERSKELTRQFHRTFQKILLPFRAMQRPRQVGNKWAPERR